MKIFVINEIRGFRVKEKEERQENEQSPNTSVSSMSPLSDRSGAGMAPPVPATALDAQAPASAPASAPLPAPALAASSALAHAPAASSLDTLRHLQGVSHRGYGAPVHSWNGTHSALSRQVCIMSNEFNSVTLL